MVGKAKTTVTFLNYNLYSTEMNWAHIVLLILGIIYLVFAQVLVKISKLRIWVINTNFNESQSKLILRVIGVILIVIALVTAKYQ